MAPASQELTVCRGAASLVQLEGSVESGKFGRTRGFMEGVRFELGFVG